MISARRFAMAISLIVALSSCVAPQVLGPSSASISDADVREIRLLVAQRPDIKQGVFKIWAERTDRAIVQSGSQSHVDAEYSQFTALKTHGHWRIASPIELRHLYGTG